MRHRERDLTTDLIRSINRLDGCWAYKIPDAVGGSPYGIGGRRPFDVVCSFRGQFVAIEVKVSDRPGKSISWASLEDSQISALADLTSRCYTTCLVAAILYEPYRHRRLHLCDFQSLRPNWKLLYRKTLDNAASGVEALRTADGKWFWDLTRFPEISRLVNRFGQVNRY